MEYSAAYRLGDEIRRSEEYMTYHSLKEQVMGDETLAALIREYRRMQVSIQMNMMTGRQTDPEETQRFSTLSSLLFAKPEVSQFLMAEMRLQQALADIMKIVTEATGLEVQLPGQ
ncbi:MAG: YlbF family regulator [Clostridia bacterium]|nr:YlbF family regulator [Clostridia bacterium]